MIRDIFVEEIVKKKKEPLDWLKILAILVLCLGLAAGFLFLGLFFHFCLFLSGLSIFFVFFYIIMFEFIYNSLFLLFKFFYFCYYLLYLNWFVLYQFFFFFFLFFFI